MGEEDALWLSESLRRCLPAVTVPIVSRAGGRPIVPVVFGVDDATLRIIKGAVEAVVMLAGHKMAVADPDIGANLMIFFLRDWRELLDVPDLDRMIEALGPLVARLEAAGAGQYRVFRYDPAGAIMACFSFVRVDAVVDAVPAEVLALDQAVRMMLLWSDRAFSDGSPLALVDGSAVLRADVAVVIRAAYDPVLPDVARDASHALRVAARVGKQ